MIENHCLVPFERSEAMTLKQAAEIAGRTVNTIRNWCEARAIGRMIAGRWYVSRAALAMFLDGDHAALAAYFEGDRTSSVVAKYLNRYAVCSQNAQ
ncbi:helix-turn-helix domain-containing protein [Tardiphaga sp. vice304]|uniref:helix-turn-helix domain-containing protein n=1 Tax=Tardiphaga sp. vice304 TaxID=2592817 RepID=UPI0011627738|nr:helix-turn-helix domain-containing protein [Tardiphaga sp. vice304]QDM27509.1 helix-turn-helix domain-containing protein [Tardiphaga sp. vice304]